MSQEKKVIIEGWVTTKEAVEESGYADEYIRRLARHGRIPGQKVAGRWLFKLADLMEYRKKMDALGRAKYDPWRDDLEGGRRRDTETENGGKER